MPLYLGSKKVGVTIPVSTVQLPTLVNEGAASDLLFGKQLLNDEGNVVTGTFSLDSELETQKSLIAQIFAALEGKVAGNVIATHDGNGNVTLMNVSSSSDGDGNIILE